jgi:hypothetical protein
LLQPDEFTTNSPFPAKIAENRFDQVVFGLQQAADDLDRTVRLHPSDVVSGTLPPAALRANRYLAFGPNGELAFPVPQPAGPGTTEAYWWGGTAGGTANALTISVGGAPGSYAAGQRYAFVVAANNTGAATLAVNGLGAKSIRRPDGTTLAANDLAAGTLVAVTYDGTNFRLGLPPIGDVWVKLVDVAPTNSTTIDITGFNLQNYHQISVLLIGVNFAADLSNNIALYVFRNSTLVTTGYSSVRETATGTTMTVSTLSNANNFLLTSNLVKAFPTTIAFDCFQKVVNSDVFLQTRAIHWNSSPALQNYRSSGITNGGSGWVTGFRIDSPTAFQAGVGRIVVLGLKV